MPNNIIDEGRVPQTFNKGLMNLIPKVKCPMTLKQRRPLTISSILSGMFTSRSAEKMSGVAEREGHLSEASFGFRKKRSTADCVFLLNTAIA